MSEELKDFQTAPTLTLNPFAEEEKAQPEVKKEEPLMDENVLSEEERKMADQFANQIDLTNCHDPAVWCGNSEQDGGFFRDCTGKCKDEGLGGSGRTSRECCEGAEKF